MVRILSFSSMPLLLLAAVIGPTHSEREIHNYPPYHANAEDPDRHFVMSRPPTAEQLDCAIVSVDLKAFQSCLAKLEAAETER